MKAIHIQTQHIGSNAIPPTKQVAFVSLTVDNVKISIDAYKGGSSYSGEPRIDSFMEIADEKEVFELCPELLMHIIRYFVEYSGETDKINRFRNRYHYIVRDELKMLPKG